MYKICHIYNDWGTCRCMGGRSRPFPNGEDGKLALGVCVLKYGRKNPGPGNQLPRLWEAVQYAGQISSPLGTNVGSANEVQSGAWYLSILEGITYLLTFIVTIMMMRRASTKKKMSKVRESLAMEAGYRMGGIGQESGTTYAGKKYMPLGKESPHF
jgi:hypothetical protein